MRYEKGHKDATHDRILEAAAYRFRQQGIAASGVAGIMSDAGLTNGAFYAHFSSKKDMIAKSLERANDEQWQRFEKAIESGRLMEIVRAYLSEEHRDQADSGCPSAALLPEISRQGRTTRHSYTASVKRLVNAVEKQLPNIPKGPKGREVAIGLFGLLVGTLQLSRAVDDPSFSKAVLIAGTRLAATLIQSSVAGRKNRVK
jgi:AcrR family transcriptional regulator